MNGFLGCLFILIFAAFFFVLGIVRMLHSLLTGGKSNTFNPFYTNRSRRQTFGGTHFGQNGTNETFRDAGFEQDETNKVSTLTFISPGWAFLCSLTK